jgi:AraC-like DNA-binding protein
VKIQNLAIPPGLQNYVECIRIVEHISSNPVAINVCLNGLPGLVFQHHNGQSPVERIETSSGSAHDIPTLYVYGQMTQPGIMHHNRAPFTTCQFVLKPHALPALFGINAALLTNRVVDLAEFAAHGLNLRLMEIAAHQDNITLLTHDLQSRLERAKSPDRLIETSLHLIHRQRGAITVKALLEALCLSERQFEKRFSQTVGLTPQFYIRIRRFNEAIQMMKSCRFPRLIDVASRLNFYDQSHFSRDIKAFSGSTPRALFQKLDDVHPDQKVYAYTSA